MLFLLSEDELNTDIMLLASFRFEFELIADASALTRLLALLSLLFLLLLALFELLSMLGDPVVSELLKLDEDDDGDESRLLF